MMENQCQNKLQDIMRCNEFDAINAEKIFASNAKQNPITVVLLVKNGSNEKEQIIVDFVQSNSKSLINIQTRHSKLFAKEKNAKI